VENRIRSVTICEPSSDAGRGYRPAGLRLVTAEAGAAVGAKILEERIVGRERRAAGLKGRNRASRIVVDLESGDDRRGLLNALIGAFEAAHGLQ